MKSLLFLGACFLSVASAFAQTDCPDPSLKLYKENSELNEEGFKLPATVSLVLQNNSTCPTKNTYEIVSGKLYLIRDNRPYGSMEITGPQLDMSFWLKRYQAGDRIVIHEINANRVSVKGEKEPYAYSEAMSWKLK